MGVWADRQAPQLGLCESAFMVLDQPMILAKDANAVQEVELYAEVHRDVAASNYTPIGRESCKIEEHVSPRPQMQHLWTSIIDICTANFAGLSMHAV